MLMIKIKGYYIVIKLVVFLVLCLIFRPLALIIGRENYTIRACSAIKRFLDKLYQCGFIDEEDKKELEQNMLP